GIKMLVIVIILYALLWLPMNVFQLCLNIFCYPDNPYSHFCGNMLLIQLLYISCHYLTSDIKQLRHRLIQFQTSRKSAQRRLTPQKNAENYRLKDRIDQNHVVPKKLYTSTSNRTKPAAICTYVFTNRTKRTTNDTTAATGK
ncbi:unnamed protein product, partial [Didymodactylos carnosus]